MNSDRSYSIIHNLDTIKSESGNISLTQLFRHSALLNQYRAWCRNALAKEHLVTVACTLYQELGASENDLRAIGIPVDILEQFPNWRYGSMDGFRPFRSRLKLSPAGAGYPINSLRIQLSPSSETIPYALMLLRDLLNCMNNSTWFTVTVEPGANLDGLQEIIRQFSTDAENRVQFVELKCITVFAQDNAISARDEYNNPVLIIPRAFRRGDNRAEDELSPKEAEKAFGIKVVRSGLYWEGGNVIHDTDRCLIGVDTIAENMIRFGLNSDEVLEIFSAEFGCEVVPLGNLSCATFDITKEHIDKSGQSAFHIDMDVSLLGRFGKKIRPRALVSDPARGLDFLPSVLAHQEFFSNHFVLPEHAKELIETEYYAYADERHQKLLGYCATLEELGYMVIGVPDLRIDPAENLFRTVNFDFSYCNILPGLWKSHPAIYYLPLGIRDMDIDAEKCFRKAGVEPVMVSSNSHISNALMKLYGGLHCFCGQLT